MRASFRRMGLAALVLALGGGCKKTSDDDTTTPDVKVEREKGLVRENPEIHGGTFVLRGGRVMTAAGVIYDEGDVLVEDGKITAVGIGIEVPKGVEVIDVKGKHVTPGIIDTHSHMGVYASPGLGAHSDGNEMVGPVTAYARARDGYWPQDPQLEHARAGGITAAQILPGSANLIGGRSFTIKLYPNARSADDVHFPGAPDGLKMACGENPKRVYGEKGGPHTRMGNVAGYRKAFQEAVEYQRKWDEYARKLAKYEAKKSVDVKDPFRRGEKDTVEIGPHETDPGVDDPSTHPSSPPPTESDDPNEPGGVDAPPPDDRRWTSGAGDDGNDDDDDDDEKKDDDGPPEPPGRDFGLETLSAVIDGKILVHNHCYRADEMSLMLDLAAEFGFSIRSFHHAVEAYKIADRLAAANTAASVWADWWGFKAEAYDGVRENAAMISAAGAKAIIHSDSAIGIQRLNQEAAKAMYAGRRAGLKISEDEALVWITANPAWALGVEHLVGTLEEGKHADIVIWDQNPFSVYAKAEQVFIEGDKVYDRFDPAFQHPSDFEVGFRPGDIEGGAR